MRRRPIVAVAVTAFILLLVWLVFASTRSSGFAGLAGVILFASLAKFYFPTGYRLSDKNIVVKTFTQTLNKSWSDYRRAWPDKNGVLLSPFPERSRLENFRGLYIMFSDNRDEVIQFVQERVGRDRTSESGD